MVTDYEIFEEFIPNVVDSRVLEINGERQWVFHHLHFNGPVTDRSYVLESTDSNSRPQEDYYRVEWQLSSRYFPTVDLTTGIRPDAFAGFREIYPAHGQALTKARYAVHSDPGGFIPGWLVASITDRYVQDVVTAIRHRLAAQTSTP